MARIRTTTLQKRKQDGTKITMLTAYDFPTARLLDASGIDCILVGDSLGMALQGHSDTLSVTMDAMVYHTSMVSRAAEHALVIADMPFLSYQVTPEEALRNAGRLVAEGGAHGVKLEGPASRFGEAITTILNAGIPVLGHIGLTPQSVHQIGGYKVQGAGPEACQRLIDEALGLEAAGCFAVVLELVQADTTAAITKALRIPTIGIGSGPDCDGQVLIMHDMLGFPTPASFLKVFGDAYSVMKQAFESYIHEVREGSFPGEEHTRR